MSTLVERWSNINTATGNLEGMRLMIGELESSFRPLGGEMQKINLPPIKQVNLSGKTTELAVGQALSIRKRANAAQQLFLGGHMDTVFAVDSPFQKTSWLSPQKLQGPGVTDMKGGLMVMLKALEALERSPQAPMIGWEVLITPDEEMGSISSAPLLLQSARRNRYGLVFEPALPDGSLVSNRKGSANYTLVVRGKAAHAGRDFSSGRNAIVAMAKLTTAFAKLTDLAAGVTLNVGQVQGGSAPNVVAELAVCRLNIRVATAEQLLKVREEMVAIVHSHQEEGITIQLVEQSARPPKPFDQKTQQLFEQISGCAKELHIPLSCRESGGVCDGNNLSAAGLPTIDTMGVVGGSIHTEEEYLFVDSLVERAQLTALFLMSLA